MAVDIRRNQIFHTPGRFGWTGGFGTTAYTDPAEGMIGILFTQRMMDSPEPPQDIRPTSGPWRTEQWNKAIEVCTRAWSGQTDGTNRPTVPYSKERNLPLHNCMSTRVWIPIGAGLFLFLIQMLQIEGYVRRHSCGFSKGLIVRIAMFRTPIERGAIKKV